MCARGSPALLEPRAGPGAFLSQTCLLSIFRRQYQPLSAYCPGTQLSLESSSPGDFSNVDRNGVCPPE